MYIIYASSIMSATSGYYLEEEEAADAEGGWSLKVKLFLVADEGTFLARSDA